MASQLIGFVPKFRHGLPDIENGDKIAVPRIDEFRHVRSRPINLTPSLGLLQDTVLAKRAFCAPAPVSFAHFAEILKQFGADLPAALINIGCVLTVNNAVHENMHRFACYFLTTSSQEPWGTYRNHVFDQLLKIYSADSLQGKWNKLVNFFVGRIVAGSFKPSPFIVGPSRWSSLLDGEQVVRWNRSFIARSGYAMGPQSQFVFASAGLLGEAGLGAVLLLATGYFGGSMGRWKSAFDKQLCLNFYLIFQYATEAYEHNANALADAGSDSTVMRAALTRVFDSETMGRKALLGVSLGLGFVYFAPRIVAELLKRSQPEHVITNELAYQYWLQVVGSTTAYQEHLEASLATCLQWQALQDEHLKQPNKKLPGYVIQQYLPEIDNYIQTQIAAADIPLIAAELRNHLTTYLQVDPVLGQWQNRALHLRQASGVATVLLMAIGNALPQRSLVVAGAMANVVNIAAAASCSVISFKMVQAQQRQLGNFLSTRVHGVNIATSVVQSMILVTALAFTLQIATRKEPYGAKVSDYGGTEYGAVSAFLQFSLLLLGYLKARWIADDLVYRENRAERSN